MRIKIRQGLHHDIPIIEEIASRAYQQYVDVIGKHPAPMVADFRLHLTHDIIFVATEINEDIVVGYAVLLNKDAEYWLENIAVHPDKSGQGIGSQLIAHIEEYISGNASHYHLYTNEQMTKNITWYTDLGFDETRRCEEDGFNRVFFTKKLNPNDGL